MHSQLQGRFPQIIKSNTKVTLSSLANLTIFGGGFLQKVTLCRRGYFWVALVSGSRPRYGYILLYLIHVTLYVAIFDTCPAIFCYIWYMSRYILLYLIHVTLYLGCIWNMSRHILFFFETCHAVFCYIWSMSRCIWLYLIHVTPYFGIFDTCHVIFWYTWYMSRYIWLYLIHVTL